MSLKYAAILSLACIGFIPQHAAATPPDLTFMCDEFPEICINMCWAVRCASPSFSQHLTFDFPSRTTTDNRRQAAGCGRDNKCSDKGIGQPGHRGPPNIACVEYPFASTKEADQGHAVSRCVPVCDQNYQDAKLSALQKKWKKEGMKRSFLINFGNPGETKYCNNDPCTNDGFEIQDGIGKRDANRLLFRYYRTRSGIVLASTEAIEAQSNFTREIPKDETLHASFDTWTEDSDLGEVRMVQDTVVEELPWNHFQSSAGKKTTQP